MQYLYFQLESVLPTVGASHKHHASLLQPHDSNVVAAAVRQTVLHALVSPLHASVSSFPVNIRKLFKHQTHNRLCLPPVSYWPHPLHTSGQISSRLSLTSPIPRASGHRQPEPTQKSRWTPREGRSWTRRSWTGIGWTGCTRFHVPWSYSA